MSLKRIFNANHGRGYARGFLAPSTAFVNTECAKLTLGRSEPEVLVQDMDSPVPEFLDIRVRLVPTYHPHSVTQILDKLGLRAIRPVANTQIYEKIEIQLDGEIICYEPGGSVMRSRKAELPQGKLILGDRGSLGVIRFILGTQEDIIQEVQRLKGTENVAQTFFNIIPLGGVFDPSKRDIQHIQQRFLSISTEGVGLGAKLSTLEDWHKQGIFPPEIHEVHDQTVQFHVSAEDAPLLKNSFAQDLYRGGTVVHLQAGTDQENNHIDIPYHSMDVTVKTAEVMVIRFQRGDWGMP